MSLKDSFRQLWQGRQDRAVALAQGYVPGITVPPGAAGTSVASVGTQGSQGNLAPELSIPPSGVQTIEIKNANGSSSIYGVPGTLITSGFLVPWESNPLLMGRMGIDTYHKMRSADTQVDKTLEMCYQPILSAKWDIQPDPDAPGKESLKKEIAAKAKENLFHELGWYGENGVWNSQGWNDVLRNCLLMLCMGVSAHERVFRIDGDMLSFARFADLPPRTFYRFDVEPDGRTLRALIQLGFRREYYSQLAVPAERLTMFVHRQEGADLWGRSMLRPAYPHWYVKNALYKVRSLAAERNGLGIPCITLPPNPSADDTKAAYEFVTDLAAHKRTGLRLPSGATFKIHGVEGSVYDSMPDVIHHNEQISFVALDFFSNLGRGSGGASGNRALGASQGKFFILALQNVASYITQRFTQIDLRYWTVFNYGVDAPVPLLTVANVQSRSFEEVMNILSNAAANGLVKSDKSVRGEIRNQTGMPEETDEDVIAVRGETVTAGKETGQISGKSAEPVPGAGKAEAGEQQPEGKQKGKAQASEAVMLAATKVPLRVPRATPSTFWREGDPEHLRNVYAHESHVDFASHWRKLRSAEARLKQEFAAAKKTRVRGYAELMAKALKAGKSPSQVVFPHSEELKSKVEDLIAPLYQFGRKEVRAEHERLIQKMRNLPPLADSKFEISDLRSDAVMLAQGNARVGIIADLAFHTAEDLDTDLANASRKAGIDLLRSPKAGIQEKDAGELADELFGAIDSTAYVDAGMDAAADAAARSAFRYGRGDEFDAIADELAKQGYKLKMVRVCAMEKESCDSCREADGQEVEPGDDLTAIHEGPPETCECEEAESI